MLANWLAVMALRVGLCVYILDQSLAQTLGCMVCCLRCCGVFASQYFRVRRFLQFVRLGRCVCVLFVVCTGVQRVVVGLWRMSSFFVPSLLDSLSRLVALRSTTGGPVGRTQMCNPCAFPGRTCWRLSLACVRGGRRWRARWMRPAVKRSMTAVVW